MEKRFLATMIAMVAFFMIVSYIYPILYPPPPKARPTQAASQASAGGAGAPGLAVAPQGPAGAPAGASTDPWAIGPAQDSLEGAARDVPIKTQDFSAIVSESGGRLKSFALNAYLKDKINPNAPDGPLEMVNPKKRDWPLELWLSQENGDGRVNLANLRFAADRAKVEVGPGGTQALTLTARTNVGLTVSRVLTFKGEGYLVGQEIKLTNEGAYAYQGRLGQSVPVSAYSLRPTRYGAVAGFINQELFSEPPADAGEEL
ncbi:MAG: membrane protein insertase YidC, partial [Deltaproteobacteria bacterium]|nr:membrane protein insertase YidC [Deltaproteobacteria bacterium]